MKSLYLLLSHATPCSLYSVIYPTGIIYLKKEVVRKDNITIKELAKEMLLILYTFN